MMGLPAGISGSPGPHHADPPTWRWPEKPRRRVVPDLAAGRYFARAAIAIVALAWMLVPLGVCAAVRATPADAPIRLRLGTQTSADRLVLESDRTFAMTRSQDGNTTVLTFDRALQGDVREVDLRLSRWILSSNVDGAVLQLQLRHRVELLPARSSDRQVILTFRPGDPVPPADNIAASPAPPELPALLAEDAIDRSTVSATVPETAAVVDGASRENAVVDKVRPKTTAERRQPAPNRLPASEQARLPPSLSDLADAGPVESRLSVQATRSAEGRVAVEYGWDRPVAAAAFERDDRLWLVFAARATAIAADGFALARALEGSVVDAERVVGRDRLVFRLQLQPTLHAQFVPIDAGATGTVWRLVLDQAQTQRKPAQMPPIVALPDGSLRVAMGGGVIDLPDPRSGDRLMVMASAARAATPFAAVDLAQFEVLPSLAGLVVRPRRPDLIASGDGDTIVIGTSEAIRSGATGAADTSRSDRRRAALDIAALGPKIGRAERRTAEAALARSPHDAAARGHLVRVLLGLGLSSEAEAVLDDAGDAAAALGPLAAAAQALLAPEKVAAERFVGLGSADAAEAALWRAYLHARHGAWNQAVVAKGAAGDVLLDYPKPLRAVLGQAIVAAQIAAGDVDGALATLDGLVARSDDLEDRASWKLLQAKALLQEGGTPAARRRLVQAADQGDPQTRLAAEGAVVDLDVQAGQLALADADAVVDRLARRSEGLAVAPEMARRQARIAAAAGDWTGALDAADRASSLPVPVGDDEPVEVLPLLGRALAAADLDVFGKLRLLQGRSVEELRQPALAEQLRDLERELDGIGQPTTARALRAAAGQDRGSAVTSVDAAEFVQIADHAPMPSAATDPLATALEEQDGPPLGDLQRIDAALKAIARSAGP